MEGQHARTRRGVRHASSHSEPYVSLLHGQPERKAHLREHPSSLSQFSCYVAKVRNDCNEVEFLNLNAHPSCTIARNPREPLWHNIVHHADNFNKHLMPNKKDCDALSKHDEVQEPNP